MLIPSRRTKGWSLGLVSEQMADGRRFRVLTVVDDCKQVCLTLVADTSLSGLRVARELETLMVTRVRLRMIVGDKTGPSSGPMPILGFANRIGIDWHYIAPDKPIQNAFIESFTRPGNGGVLARRLRSSPASLVAGLDDTCPYADTFTPPRDLPFRYMNSSAPAPVAHLGYLGQNSCPSLIYGGSKLGATSA